VVAVNSDRSVRRLKGPGRPVIAEADRVALLAALSCVSYVVVQEDDTPYELLRALRPDVLVKGGTYQIENVVGREIVLNYGGQVVLTRRREGLSTTSLLAALRQPVSQNAG
jgi:D-beta-D-heptose 7-phosphate kinase/D-beta-D-heptose 1-phosphate adenosyltransferase